MQEYPPNKQTKSAWGVLKTSLAVSFLAGLAFTIYVGFPAFVHPSVNSDPGIFAVVSPFIFLFAAVPSFGLPSPTILSQPQRRMTMVIIGRSPELIGG